MNFNFWHVFFCAFKSWAITFIAHGFAQYLVGKNIFPREKMKTPAIFHTLFGLRQVAYGSSYNILVASGVHAFFFNFLFSIAPLLSIEKTCAIIIFAFTLAITVITDFYTYLISTLATLYLVPAVFFYAHMGYLDITLLQSILSAFIVGASMTLINYLYERRRGTAAFGEGDRDLLIYIAAFFGWFSTLLIIFYGSLIGSVWGITVFLKNRYSNTAISFNSYMLPFGTCLGFGAFFHILVTYGNGPVAHFIRNLYLQ